MSKIEKEYKILNIDVKKVTKLLKKIDAKEIGVIHQKLYVYDIPTIYYRFLEIKDLLKSSNKLLIETNLMKLRNLLKEYEDLVSDEEIKKILKSCNIESLNQIFEFNNNAILEILNNKELNESIKNLKINENKWIRLRQSNDKIELCSKHIIQKSNENYQKVQETEFEVSSFDEANEFLNSIGISRRSYQEKERIEFKYKDADIEIDLWPMLDPYLEIECDNDNTINEIIEKLELSDNEKGSFNTNYLYEQKGINIFEISELKFNK